VEVPFLFDVREECFCKVDIGSCIYHRGTDFSSSKAISILPACPGSPTLRLCFIDAAYGMTNILNVSWATLVTWNPETISSGHVASALNVSPPQV